MGVSVCNTNFDDDGESSIAMCVVYNMVGYNWGERERVPAWWTQYNFVNI